MSVYSYDERMRAVQFYIESGCSEIMVFHELGYPSPNALRQWYNEYMQTGTLHSKANRRDVYSQEQIDAAVAYYNEHGGSLIATCRALGYPDRWGQASSQALQIGSGAGTIYSRAEAGCR